MGCGKKSKTEPQEEKREPEQMTVSTKSKEEENFRSMWVRKINIEDRQLAQVINMSLTTYKRTFSVAS